MQSSRRKTVKSRMERFLRDLERQRGTARQPLSAGQLEWRLGTERSVSVSSDPGDPDDVGADMVRALAGVTDISRDVARQFASVAPAVQDLACPFGQEMVRGAVSFFPYVVHPLSSACPGD